MPDLDTIKIDELNTLADIKATTGKILSVDFGPFSAILWTWVLISLCILPPSIWAVTPM